MFRTNRTKPILPFLTATLFFHQLVDAQESHIGPVIQHRGPKRPYLLTTAQKVEGLRSVQELRRLVKTGQGQLLWKELKRRADRDLARDPISVEYDNWMFMEYEKTAARVMRHALAFVVTGDETYKNKAFEQIEVAFDPNKWPKHWREGNQPDNLPFGLRAGRFCAAFGLAYDWLHAALTPEERARFVAGLDRQAIQPYLRTLEKGYWQVNVLGNFCSIINGGVGIAAMAMGEDHPEFQRLMFETRERMIAYRDHLSEIGPEGEWPESVDYSLSYRDIVQYFACLQYWSTTHEHDFDQNLLNTHPIPQFCRWLMYMTLPDGRVAQTGNCGRLQSRIALSFVPAVAGAARDGVLQWYYLKNQFLPEETWLRRNYSMELLGYDPSVRPLTPNGRLPRGHAFAEATMGASSRSDWDPAVPACLVYGKAGAAYEVHGHHDIGQVCIHGYGDPLIVDVRGRHLGGNTSESDSKVYYVASSHNVLTFDGDDMVEDRPASRALYKQPEIRETPPLRAKLIESLFDDALGGYWTWDTSDVYEGVRKVQRTVVHLDPDVVVVLDSATLTQPRDVSLRWHTATESHPDSEGSFSVKGIKVGSHLAARVVRIDGGSLELAHGNNEQMDSFIDVAQSRKAGNYVEASLRGSKCDILSLFCVYRPDKPSGAWRGANGRWTIGTQKGLVDVTVKSKELSVIYRASGRGWRIRRQAAVSG